MKRLLLIFCALVVGKIYADEPENLESTMREIATDLSVLHNELQNKTKENQVKLIKYPPADIADVLSVYYGFEDIKITNPGFIYSGADLNADPVKEVKQGDKFPIVDKAPGWYAVRFDNTVDGDFTGWVPAAHAVPEFGAEYVINQIQGEQAIEQKEDISDFLYKMIVESVTSVKKKYEKNPHVVVNGFSVDIGVPPELSIQFEFK